MPTSTPERSGSGVKTSGDWMSLFLGSSSSRGGGLSSPSLYSSPSSSSIGSSRLYNRSSSYTPSEYGSGTSYGSRYYSRTTSSYLDNYRTSTNTPSSSRSLRFQNSIDRTKIDLESQKTRQIENNPSPPDHEETRTSQEDHVTRPKTRHRATVLNGSVVRISRNQAVNESSSDEDEDDEDDESDEESIEDTAAESEHVPELPSRPLPPPEDPLVVEERMLNAQLALSFTLTMTDEENIRQRLLEIRKQRMKRSQSETESVLLDKFERESEELCESTRAKEEEEKILVQRLSAEGLREVEQKDIQVRLQELFRDRRNTLDTTKKSMESHYEHMLQETSTEMTELEASIRGKQQLMDKIQEEILSMTVKKELLSSGINKINHRHQERSEQIDAQQKEIDQKMSQFAVLAPPPCTRKSTNGMSESELKELEQELECPICMDISRPPIYQCEEGHIICSTCKPLLTHCPHCSKLYLNPVIRCRFAEKLADKYFKLVEKVNEELAEET
ncbi:hypothetical protein TCAL_08235 [Tigriopus californicus]|uniref:E3 ubiquitin-protein ligase Sina-like RING finger domain-containing protein n=1 Tax=Tigriopus californicus TaxID=6832 RepID=A0A553NCE6_TIGCA|nr:homeobox protein prospero-like [Tigriopus californicus]TRY63116.1 hypothetical protein TCAL_08235 [Tigriopus californicus]|eukprot:TCALIF_08235-PA protein Name:"Similar to siah1 E3 ubiquitin-protein ligase Siah1 (Danio rerio)" AED:0.00 eAED:0.00 QI:64/1/0.66/1/1/1/3/204/502